VAAPPYLSQQLEAVEPGKPDVEEHQVVAAFERLSQAEVAVVYGVEAHAVVRQHLPHHSTQALVIVDEQTGERRLIEGCRL
jgi:hypothetical protein